MSMNARGTTCRVFYHGVFSTNYRREDCILLVFGGLGGEALSDLHPHQRQKRCGRRPSTAGPISDADFGSASTHSGRIC
ncbi:Hypothetical protein BN69_1841 [Methylocystis sp. SC2]|nr:Hypothetical protein BN69_1841 [Methylocystis sp. SC2]